MSFHYNTSFKNTLALIMLRLRLMSYKMGSNAFYASHRPNTHATYSTPRAARMLTKRNNPKYTIIAFCISSQRFIRGSFYFHLRP